MDLSINYATEQYCYAVKVRSNGEHRTADALRQKGHHVLLPHYLQFRRYSDRIKKVPRALFPGYVFVCMNERSVLSVVTTFGVHYIVGFGSTLKPLAEHEAKAVEALCEPKVKSEPCEIYTVGKKVVITQGYFCGLTGTLQNVKDQTKVIISIDSLQIAFRVTLSPCAFTIF